MPRQSPRLAQQATDRLVQEFFYFLIFFLNPLLVFMVQEYFADKASASNEEVSSNNESDSEYETADEYIVEGLNDLSFTPFTRQKLEARFQTDLINIYISCSEKNQNGRRRFKVGSSITIEDRATEQAACGMHIKWIIPAPEGTVLKSLILDMLKTELMFHPKPSLSRRTRQPNSAQQPITTNVPFIRKIVRVGRHVKCPCGKRHDEIFVTEADDEDFMWLQKWIKTRNMALIKRAEEESLFLRRGIKLHGEQKVVEGISRDMLVKMGREN